jgi:hypothetical protein
MMRAFLCASLMTFLAIGTVASETPIHMDQIPLDIQTFVPANGAGLDQFLDQKAAFQKAVHAYLDRRYQIVSERFLVLQPKGAQIKAGINDFVYTKPEGKEVAEDILPAQSAITVWKKEYTYFALAVSAVLPFTSSLDSPSKSKINARRACQSCVSI